jgi:RNA polymerase sigma-54 factor
MPHSPRINVTQTQRLQLNTALQASIKVLRADAAGLTKYLEEQAADNPHLRLAPAPAPLPGEWLPRWSPAFRSADFPGRDEVQAAAPSLINHVLTRIQAMFAPGRPRQIALVLAEALEPSGWLGRPLPALAAEAGASLAEAEAVLAQLQKIEPTGLFARDLAECLRLQLAEAGALDRAMGVMLAHLDLLAQGAHERLARLCGTDVAEVARRFRLIRTLDPKPGAQFEPFAASGMREPDLLARPNAAGDGWEIALNRSALPAVEVRRAAVGTEAALATARALQRAVRARNATLLRVGQEILRRQWRALEAGPAALVPMQMADLAAALDLHVSTISRVVAGTAVDTPRGTWWLRALFSRAVGKPGDGEAGEAPAASTAALRDRLARLVAEEDVAAPLSDEDLVARLTAEGLPLARRTVAKYRALLHIPPAHRRRRR